MKLPRVVARRSLVLELLLQRYGLETDEEGSVDEREEARAAWVDRLGDLGVDEEIAEGERALLSQKVGELSDDELDDVHGRAAGALVLLWALGRLPVRPSFADVDTMETAVLDHGILGSGSIKGAKATIDGASLRPEAEIEAGRFAYQQIRGKAREPSSPDAVFADVGVHHLAWVLDPELAFDGDD